MNNRRKPVVFAFGVVAGILVLTSTAFACTVFSGRFTVAPSSPGSGSVTAVGDNRGMGYCAAPSGTANLPSPSGAFLATVSAAAGIAGCNGGNGSKLAQGLYTVTWTPGSSANNYGVYDPRINDCMNFKANRQLGTMVVDSAGNGSGSYTLSGTDKTAYGEVQICVSTLTGGAGNQVPVTLI